jgi:hypothetical protein
MKTSEELHALHRELWGWLAEHPSRGKHNWPGWKRCVADDPSRNLCFACTEARIRAGENDQSPGTSFATCKLCPISWNETSCDSSNGSPYYRFMIARTGKTKKKYAAIIRDLPWSPRPEVRP